MIKKIKKSDWVVASIYWLFAGPFILSSYIKDFGMPQAVYGILFNIAFDTATVFAIVFLVVPRFLPKRQYLRMMFALMTILIISGIIYIKGYGMIFDWSAHSKILSFKSILWGVIHNGQSYGVFAMFLLAKQYVQTEQRYLRAEKEKKESELKRLQAHIDPHFLFNNLNTLDVLIEQNQTEARQYLQRLSSLYRYLIRQKDNEVVSLEEEWAFADNYIYLLRQRFGGAYNFQSSMQHPRPSQVYLPPGALQALIENTVKHNQGDDHAPTPVHIRAHADTLEVSNPIRPKLDNTTSNGTGLSNLKARYSLLTDRPVSIKQNNGHFTVTLPLIKSL